MRTTKTTTTTVTTAIGKVRLTTIEMAAAARFRIAAAAIVFEALATSTMISGGSATKVQFRTAAPGEDETTGEDFGRGITTTTTPDRGGEDHHYRHHC